MSNSTVLFPSLPIPSEQAGTLLELPRQKAGWEWMDFFVRRLLPGNAFRTRTGDEEAAFVILGGTCLADWGQGPQMIGKRSNVFAGLPYTVYLPAHGGVSFLAETSCEIAECRVPTEARHEAKLITPQDIDTSLRGGSNISRQIVDVLPPAFAADKLVVIEVYTPGGNWSSFPPHKHDTHNPPAEVDLDEIYYFRVAQPGGFALQHLYSDVNPDGRTVKARDGDVVLVRDGYHTVVAGPGYDVYYLNFLAGTSRSLAVSEDRQQTWIRSAWGDPDPPLASYTEISDLSGVLAGLMTKHLTVAQAIVGFLGNQYVERDGYEFRFIEGCLGIFGHGNVAGMGQALEQDARLRYYLFRNEQAMVHTATAFAKATFRMRMLACTTSIGPGATNMVTGAALATINRIPVLLLPGDIFARRNVAPVLQQLESSHTQDISVNDCLRPVSRYWDRIQLPEQVLTSMPEAMRVLTSPVETGAVTICLPQDVQTEAFDFPEEFFHKRVWRIPRARCDAAALRRAVEWIKAAKAPMIIAGGGVLYSQASEVLSEFASATGIPVGESQAGKGSLPFDHAQEVGAVGATGTSAANALARDADLIIGIGTRYSDFTSASKTAFQNPAVRFININVSEFDAHKHAAIALTGDARGTLEELRQAVGSHTAATQYRSKISGLKAAWDENVRKLYAAPKAPPITQAEIIRIVNDFTEPSDILVGASGSTPGDLHKLWRTRQPGGYHMEYGYSCMGYEIAGGLGVKMAYPDREVYVLVGDGSFLMMAQEIVTSIQEGYKFNIVLIDNHGFSSIGGLSRSCGNEGMGTEYRYRKDGKYTGDPVSVDFESNAASLGAWSIRVSTPEELKAALSQARKQQHTAVIVIEAAYAQSVPGYESWWDVPIAEVSEKETVKTARRQYEEARKKERYFF